MLPQLVALQLNAGEFREFSLVWGAIIVVQTVVRSSIAERVLASGVRPTPGNGMATLVVVIMFLSLGAVVAGLPYYVWLPPLLFPLARFEIRRYANLAVDVPLALRLDALWAAATLPGIWLGATVLSLDVGALLLGWIAFPLLWESVAGLQTLWWSPGLADAAEGEPSKFATNSASWALAADSVVAASVGFAHLVVLARLLTTQEFSDFRATFILAGPLIAIAPALGLVVLRGGKAGKRGQLVVAGLAASAFWYLSLTPALPILNEHLPRVPNRWTIVAVSVALWQIAYTGLAPIVPELRHAGHAVLMRFRLVGLACLLAPVVPLLLGNTPAWLALHPLGAWLSLLVFWTMSTRVTAQRPQRFRCSSDG